MDGTVHMPRLAMLSRLLIGESFVEESEEMDQDYIEKRVEEANMEMNKLQEEESKPEARKAVRRLRSQSCAYEYLMWLAGSEEVAVWPIWLKY
ncbi:hypothetical protein PsorP6_004251 [Peronosclerospora sorghi]|uniref:Uncharacterized protein n=1 Tax=Peronosclerospora sorghi TaxID=230839 RepID=A0ACC0VPR5_9STRA|nr:hypothetical protein PsorP6_004251 [Peronosclerospora sorghi]